MVWGLIFVLFIQLILTKNSKMKYTLTVAFVAISILSSCQQTPETKKFDHKKLPKLDVKVVSKRRPNLWNENNTVF